MYTPSTSFSRGLLDFATPLFIDIERALHEEDDYFFEEDGDYMFEVEMPGFNKEDVNIKIDSTGHLNLQAKTKRRGKEVKFGKTYRVPQKADTSSVEAKLDKGILTLILKKKEKHKPKEIKIT
jgi:HSP20 family molecular chaperone IbpA